MEVVVVVVLFLETNRATWKVTSQPHTTTISLSLLLSSLERRVRILHNTSIAGNNGWVEIELKQVKCNAVHSDVNAIRPMHSKSCSVDPGET